MDNVKINLEELEKVLEQRKKFDYSTQPIEFLWGYDSTLIGAVPKLIERIRELEAEANIWKERVQMRQELVEQYEQDMTKFRRKIRELERQTVVLANHLSKHVMHTMSTKEWLEWSESIAKENK